MKALKQVFFVTTNRGKVESANMILSSYGIEAVQVANPVDEPSETNDPKSIARMKILSAVQAPGMVKATLICEDGGFFVNVLNGRPGASVHRYLTEHGLNGLLAELKGKEDRSAFFYGVLACMTPEMKEPVYFEERIRGQILKTPKGCLKSYSWSALHQVFVPNGENKAIAEMNENEYQQFRLKQNSRFKRLGEFLTAKPPS